MSHYAPSPPLSAATLTNVAPSDSQLAALIDGRHYQARRHSIVHPTTIRLSPPSVIVNLNLGSGHSPSVRKPLTLPVDPNAFNSPNVSSAHDAADKEGGQALTTTNDFTGGPSLTAEDVQPFCNKDTMMYALYPGLSGTTSLNLWKEMYRIWYPHRGTGAIGETGALKGGAFLAKFILLESEQDVAYSAHAAGDGGSGGVGGDDNKDEDRGEGERDGAADQIEGVLAGLVTFHEQLCKVVKGIVGTGRGLRMKGVNPRESPVAREQEKWYGLGKTFEDCLVFVEGEEWEREGVVVVWRGDRLSGEMNELSGRDRAGNRVQKDVILSEDASENQGAEGEERKGEGWKCRKMGLEEAMMKIMLAQDPDRKRGNVEKSVFWEKWYERKREKKSEKKTDENEGKNK